MRFKSQIIFIAMILILISLVSADTIKVGGKKFEYDQMFISDSDYDGKDDMTSYYLDGQLVFSSFDTNGDGKADMWFHYSDGMHKDLSMRDSSGNGRPNNILEYAENGTITNEVEKGFKMPKLPEIKLTKKNMYWGLLVLFVLFVIRRIATRKKRKAKKEKKKRDKKEKKEQKKERKKAKKEKKKTEKLEKKSKKKH